jgi:hypothetical protein
VSGSKFNANADQENAHMHNDKLSFSAARRRVLRLFGFGVTGTAIGAIGATDRIFAKQFLDEGPTIKLPAMVYDPDLQMVVDPATRLPIYEDAARITVASGLPTITSSCGDCPKKDDTGS